jgi:hypothetical protein
MYAHEPVGVMTFDPDLGDDVAEGAIVADEVARGL